MVDRGRRKDALSVSFSPNQVAELEEMWQTLSRAVGEPVIWRPMQRLRAVHMLAQGMKIDDVARQVGRQPSTVEQWFRDFSSGGIRALFPERPLAGDRHLQLFSNLIASVLGEELFYPLLGDRVQRLGYQVIDRRADHIESDYEICGPNGEAFAINVKVHSAQFQAAREMVGLTPDDCFPLALYKILMAFKQQQIQRRPFLFVVSIRWGIVDEIVKTLDPEIERLVSVVFKSADIGRRKAEDEVVRYAVGKLRARGAWGRILTTVQRDGVHRLISAKKALELFIQRFDQRCPALSIREFAGKFGGRRGVAAEVNMHFSISQEMEPLSRFLDNLEREGFAWVNRLVEAGVL